MPTPLQEHIELIARHENEFLANRTRSERLTDAVAQYVGSLVFVMVHLVLFGMWILWNLQPRVHHFDPEPFSLLSTIVALEAIVIGSFILMRQSRLSRRQDERDHLMLQVLLLNEKETTATLEISRKMAEKIGLKGAANSPEILDLASNTSIEDVAQTIKDNLGEVSAGKQPEENLAGHLLG